MRGGHGQQGHRVRAEWGLAGAEAIGADADVSVVVDVLSFTTALTVAVDAGMIVYPYRWADGTASTFAEDHGARLAVRRRAAGPGQLSLSPASIRAAPDVGRLVLPSPNGSTISHHLAASGSLVVGASLRNRVAVAAWLVGSAHAQPDLRFAVIPAGEQWPDGRLRPAVEDLWGAGAVIDALIAAGWDSISPEARSAAVAWREVSDDVGVALRDCVSGRELCEDGWQADVEIAAEVDTSRSVPCLDPDGYFSGAAT